VCDFSSHQSEHEKYDAEARVDDVISWSRKPSAAMGWYLAALISAVSMVTTTTCSSEMVLEYSVSEELPVETFVGNVATDAGFDRKYPSAAVFDRLRYKFLTLPSFGDVKFFSIDERTGVIRTATVIDRETACSETRLLTTSGRGDVQEDRCSIKFDVAVRPIEYFRIVRVRVEIVDVNDNTPTFVPDFVALEISESVQPGTEFTLPAAQDDDGPYFRVAHYDVRQVLPTTAGSLSAGPFALSVRGGNSGGNLQLRLVVRSPLDRETTDAYRFVCLLIYLRYLLIVVYRVPLTGTRSTRIVHRQSL